jgi:hypothetical protein
MNIKFREEPFNHPEDAYAPISLALEGVNPDERFTETLLECLRLADIYYFDPENLLERNKIEGIFTAALQSSGRQSLLLRRIVETLLEKMQSGVVIENISFMIQSLQNGENTRLFGKNSLTEGQSSEFAVLLMLGIHQVMADEFHVDVDTMNTMEVYWFLQYLKYQDASRGSISQLYMTRDEFIRLGIWQTFVRVASLCQQSEGFDTLQRLENVIHLMNSNSPEGSQSRSLIQTIEQYLDEIQRVTEELIESMMVNEFDNSAVATIHDALLSRLRKDVYNMINEALSQGVGSSLSIDTASRAQYGSRIAIARELNHYIATSQGALGGQSGSETGLLVKLLNVQTEEASVENIPEMEKVAMVQMFRLSREKDLTTEELERDTAGFVERLRTPGVSVRIVRDTNNRLISFACLAPDWNDPDGIYVTNLTFGPDPDIILMRGVLSVACFTGLAEDKNVYFSVYRKSPAYQMYLKRSNAIEDTSKSSPEVAVMMIPSRSTSKTE